VKAARGAAARLSVALPGASAGEALAAARLAERNGIDGLWLGTIAHAAPMADRYALTALAGIARATGELRLGIVLGGLASDEISTAETIHLAEDLGAADNISNGRLEIAFVPGGSGWAKRAETLLGLWTDGLELSDGRCVAVTPAPAQPRIPCLVIGEDADARQRIGAGRWLAAGTSAGTGASGRTVLAVDLTEPVSEWLGASPGARLDALREEVAERRATEVVVVSPGGFSEEDLAALGTIVGPCLRCAPDQVGRLAVLAGAWLQEGGPMSADWTPSFAVDPD
jgi:hypothetical protein